MAFNKLPLIERLLTKSVNINSCLIFQGTKCAKGYGKIRIGKRYRSAHRVMYEIYHGEIADGMVVMHSCDTPACININHLSVGTQYENMRDMHNKGRAIFNCGENNQNTKLNLAQIDEIRIKYKFHDRKCGATALSKEYGVDRRTILAIINGSHWSKKQKIPRPLITYNGFTHNTAQWAAKIGIKPSSLYARFRAGWGVERALTETLQDHSIKGSAP